MAFNHSAFNHSHDFFFDYHKFLDKLKYFKLGRLEERAPDGVGNNKARPNEGAHDDEMTRVTPNSYKDGKGEMLRPGDAGWVDPRTISNKVMAQPKDSLGKDLDIPNSFGVNEYFQFFGQFLTHDIAEVPLAGATAPPSDLLFLDGLPFPFARTPPHVDSNGIRQQVDEETSFLDLSSVYGRNQAMQDLLREDLIVNGVRTQSAKMLVGDDTPLPTFNDVVADSGVLLANVRTTLNGPPVGAFDPEQYAVGDQRGNQNAALLTHHVTWVANHNYHVDKLTKLFPEWTQEQLFEGARALNEAEWQNVVYNEYLPKLLGEGALDKFRGYDSKVDPSVINEWTTVAFRFGHDQSANEFATLAENGASTGSFTLAASFNLGNTAQAIRTSGQMDEWVRGQLSSHTQEIDGKVVEGNRNLLFGIGGPSGPVTVDLEVFDIARGRDHGVGNYQKLYEGLFGNERGFNQYDTFDEFALRNGLDAETLAALKDVYGNDMSKADSIVMGLLEKPHEGGMLGETFSFLTVMQFENLRDGDRQFYLERFKDQPHLIKEIEATSLADILERTTDIDHIYHDGFAAHTRKSGTANAETVEGSDKADLLIAYAGDDIVKGGKGKDDIYAGEGNDKIWGGYDADLFVFEKKSGKDIVYDFNAKEDRLDLSEYGFDSLYEVRYAAKQTKSGVIIKLDDYDSVELIGVKLHKLSAKNFVFDENDAYAA